MAAHFGLYEAIILQFLFWVKNEECAGRVLEDGHRYCYNTYADWHKIYPFISERTLRRTFGEMESKGLICSTQLSGYDRTKFYRISEAIVAQDSKGFFDELPSNHNLQEENDNLPCGQLGLNDAAKLAGCTNVHRSHESFLELKNSSPDLDVLVLSSEPVEKVEIQHSAPKKRGRPPKPADPRHRQFIEAFSEAHLERTGEKYFVSGHDGSALKRLLSHTDKPVSELMEMVKWCWYREKEDKWCPKELKVSEIWHLCSKWNTINKEAVK